MRKRGGAHSKLNENANEPNVPSQIKIKRQKNTCEHFLGGFIWPLDGSAAVR